MNNREKSSLDSHTTGNYGEDQFQDYIRTEHFSDGIKARLEGKSLSSNPFTENSIEHVEWKHGWADQDMVLNMYGEEE